MTGDSGHGHCNGIFTQMAPCQLLIAEDDKALLEMLCWEFEEMGYSVIAASSCYEALSAVAGCKIDLALLDYNLPDGVGTDILLTLHRKAANLPVVIYSGRASCSKAVEAEKCGASHFIAKPVAATSLHTLFQHLL